MIEKPPPVLGSGRVLEYAILDDSVTHSGRSSVFVGSPAGLVELGPVRCLAITQDLRTGEISLLHCGAEWEVLGLGGNYDTIEQAKSRAERAYHGLSSLWIDANVSRDEALKYVDEVWGDERCTFCGKNVSDVALMMTRDDARICDSCIDKFYEAIREHRTKK